MNILDFFINCLPHFNVFLKFNQVIFTNDIFNELVSSCSSSHVEIGDDNLTDKYCLIRLKLVNAFKFFLCFFNWHVYLFLSHRWSALNLACNSFKQIWNVWGLLWRVKTHCHIYIISKLTKFLCFNIQFVNLLLEWVMLLSSVLLKWCKKFTDWN